MRKRRIPTRDGVYRVELVPHAELGESPLWPTAAIVASALLYVTLPGRFILGRQASFFGDIRWIVAGLTVVLLAALLLSVPNGPVARAFGWGVHRTRVSRRALALTLTAVLTAANSASIYLLVHVLVNGGQVVASPLLRAAVHLWCVNVLIFALWFWQLDGGGPLNGARSSCATGTSTSRSRRIPRSSAPDWQPTFIDYLYVSFTNSTAFSPTDTMPLGRGRSADAVAVRGRLTLGLMVSRAREHPALSAGAALAVRAVRLRLAGRRIRDVADLRPGCDPATVSRAHRAEPASKPKLAAPDVQTVIVIVVCRCTVLNV